MITNGGPGLGRGPRFSSVALYDFLEVVPGILLGSSLRPSSLLRTRVLIWASVFHSYHNLKSSSWCAFQSYTGTVQSAKPWDNVNLSFKLHIQETASNSNLWGRCILYTYLKGHCLPLTPVSESEEFGDFLIRASPTHHFMCPYAHRT